VKLYCQGFTLRALEVLLAACGAKNDLGRANSLQDESLGRRIARFDQLDGARSAINRAKEYEYRPGTAALTKKDPGLIGDSVTVEVAADMESSASAFPVTCAIGRVRKAPTRRDRDSGGRNWQKEQGQEKESGTHVIPRGLKPNGQRYPAADGQRASAAGEASGWSERLVRTATSWL